MRSFFFLIGLICLFCLNSCDSEPTPEQQVQIQIQALKSSDLQTQKKALLALGELRKKANEAVVAVKECFQQSSQEDLQALALSTLGKITTDATALIPLLENALHKKNAQIRYQALAILSQMGTETIPILTEALKNDAEEIRIFAAKTLGSFGEKAQSAIPALTVALRDSQRAVQEQAFEALTQIGADSVPEIAKNLKDQASRFFGEVSPKVKKLRPIFWEAFKKEVGELSQEALSAIESLGPDAKELIPELLETLKSGQEISRQKAAWALGKIGIYAKTAIPALQEALHDPNEKVRKLAEEALKKIQQK